MLHLLLELAPTLLIGLALGGCWPGLAASCAPLLLRWGMPISLAGLLLRAGLDASMASVALFTAVTCGGALVAFNRARELDRWFPQRALRLGAVVGNTGYLGLPIALALLPAQAVPISITIDLVGTLITWCLGPVMLHGEGPLGVRGLLPLLWRSPVMRAVVLAVPLALSPWGDRFAAWMWWPARVLLWLLLVLIGMRLADLLPQQSERATEPPWSQLVPAVLVKLLLWPTLILVMATLTGWPWPVRYAVVMQAATPSAMSVLLLAEGVAGSGRKGEVAAASRLVLISTMLAAVTLPLWWQALQWGHSWLSR